MVLGTMDVHINIHALNFLKPCSIAFGLGTEYVCEQR